MKVIKNSLIKKLAVSVMLVGSIVAITPAVTDSNNQADQVVLASRRHKKRLKRVTVTIDNQMHIDQKYMVQATKIAINDWNENTRSNFVYTPHNPHANVTIYTYDFSGNGDLGATEDKKHNHVNMYIDPEATFANDDYLNIVIEHELGHAMNLNHSKQKHSIMYYNDQYNHCEYITDRDARLANKSYAK